jgi:proteasome lid subunit RPN8/RPN11
VWVYDFLCLTGYGVTFPFLFTQYTILTISVEDGRTSQRSASVEESGRRVPDARDVVRKRRNHGHARGIFERRLVRRLCGGANVVVAGCLMITDCIQLPRNDKRPDRVEIAPEQLAEAAQQVEAMKPWWPKALPEPRLVGWYHSHPHITVLPSAVDIATQKVFEQMSTTWVGLIYAVFNRDARRVSDRYQLIAFMSNVNYEEQMTTALSEFLFLVKDTKTMFMSNVNYEEQMTTTLTREGTLHKV